MKVCVFSDSLSGSLIYLMHWMDIRSLSVLCIWIYVYTTVYSFLYKLAPNMK